MSRRHGAGAQDGSPWTVGFQRRLFDHEQMVDFMGFHAIAMGFDGMLRGFNHHQEFGLHGSVNG